LLWEQEAASSNPAAPTKIRFVEQTTACRPHGGRPARFVQVLYSGEI
jgi:hypothetical protein